MDDVRQKGVIAWFATNPVAANLLMLLILLAGGLALSQMRTEEFPALPPSSLDVTVVYESGSALETERSVTARVEESLAGLAGIKRVSSTSTASLSSVEVETVAGYELDRLLGDVKARIDALNLPARAERPSVTRDTEIEEVAFVEVHGDVAPDVLSRVTRQVRNRLLADPAIPAVEITGEPVPEVTIEVPERALRQLGLGIGDVLDRVRAFAGIQDQARLNSGTGDIVVQSDRLLTRPGELADILLVSGAQGQVVRLGDIATIIDGTVDELTLTRFDGERAIRLTVQMLGGADLLPAAAALKAIVADMSVNGQLPPGITLTRWNDQSEFMASRLSLMVKNGLMGMALVLIVLALFLNLRTAFWVAMGLPVAFAGAAYLMGTPMMGLTLNELTTFGFIIALGLVVDDAIVVAESAHSSVSALPPGQRRPADLRAAVIRGVHRVAIPAMMGVMTTIAAFYPITAVGGHLATIFGMFAWVVIFALIFSIVESKLILPAHLAQMHGGAGRQNVLARGWGRVTGVVSDGLAWFTRSLYRPLMVWAMRRRYLSLAFLLALAGAGAMLVVTGAVRTVFFPDIAGNVLTATYVAEPDTGRDIVRREADRLARAGADVAARLAVQYPGEAPPIRHFETRISGVEVTVTAALTDRQDRSMDGNDIRDMWQAALGPIEGAQSLDITADDDGFEPFVVDLTLNDPEQLNIAARMALDAIRNLPGVRTAKSGLKATRPRLQVELTPLGRSLGLTRADIAGQISDALDGGEVQRFLRAEQEVRLKVRYPAADRARAGDLDRLQIRLPDGGAVPLSAVAVLQPGFTLDEIRRVNGLRVASLTADIDKTVTSGDDLTDQFEEMVFPDLQAKFPGLQFAYDGEVEQERAARANFVNAFAMAVVIIYGLLAVPLKSWTQPLIILAAIPFGIVGAIVGHWMNGLPLSILSIMGGLALCGIVVNDSLLLVSAYNRLRGEHDNVADAIVAAGCDRLRAVVLTSVTTFAGLAPLLLEKSEGAQYLIPAAVSLAFGILFATVVTLVLIPVLLRVHADLAQVFSPSGRRVDTPVVTG